MNIKKLATCAAFASFLFATQSFADPIKTIHFATEATYPPFESVSADGKIQGFDIDVANALCQQIHAQCDFSNQPFASLIPSLNLGKFDALIAALGITPEREKQVSFTHTYYEPSASFVATIANHYTLQQLNGKTIGTQMGSTFAQYLQEAYGDKVTVKLYGSFQEAYLDLTAGRIDAVLSDTPVATAWLKEANHAAQYGIIDKPVTNATYFGSGYGIAVRKDDQALLEELNQALAAIKANGTYGNLVKKYFQ